MGRKLSYLVYAGPMLFASSGGLVKLYTGSSSFWCSVTVRRVVTAVETALSLQIYKFPWRSKSKTHRGCVTEMKSPTPEMLIPRAVVPELWGPAGQEAAERKSKGQKGQNPFSFLLYLCTCADGTWWRREGNDFSPPPGDAGDNPNPCVFGSL